MIGQLMTATGAGAAAATGPGGTRGNMSGADFETYLRMLTTQLKNQDPLNPMEGSEFAVQLATFSGVEQQAYTNKLLEQMTQGAAGSLNEAAGWIGREARTTAPVWFGSDPLDMTIQPDPAADSVVLVTLTGSGREITREEIGPGAGQVEWFGRDAAGNKLPDGQYQFRVESLRDGEKIGDSKVGVYTMITEAQRSNAGIQLVFKGGGTAMADQIDAIRAP